MDGMTVCGTAYRVIRLLGRGKGGYSYLAEHGGKQVVIKQIHHEPCDYYTFGDKMEAELRDYWRLRSAGIRIPEMIASDRQAERIVKQYIEGETVYELLAAGRTADKYAGQVAEMAAAAKAAGLNIDYFPTNFVINGGLLDYIDYECNDYEEQWDLEHWGLKYWSRTPELEAYIREHSPSAGQ